MKKLWEKRSFTQKIVFSFLIIVFLIILLGGVTYNSFIKMERLSDELTQTLMLDMFLDETMGSHRKWINDLAHFLLLGRDFEGELNPRFCDFGEWYYSFEPPDERIRKVHKEIEKPHRLLHQTAKEIVKLYDFSYSKFDALLTERRNDHLRWKSTLRRAIDQKDNKALSRCLLDEKSCDFGQWYYTYFSQDEEIIKYLSLIRKPHQQIHEAAKQIKGHGMQNQWDKAGALFVQKIFPASEKFINYLLDLEEVVNQKTQYNLRAIDIYHTQTIPAMEKLQSMVDEIRSTLMARIDKLDRQYQALTKRSKNFIIFSILLTLFLAILYSFLIPPGLTKPIRQLTHFANRIAAGGDLSETIILKNHDEIGQLASSFNEMIKALKKSKKELKIGGKTLRKKWNPAPGICRRLTSS